MHAGMGLRFKLYMMIFPVVIVAVALSGVFSSYRSFTSMTRIANRHMTFKAEQLRDFIYSEWDAISNLGLDKKPEYRPAVEKSFRSYASSLLRIETELIAVFNAEGMPVMRISLTDSLTDGEQLQPTHLPAGWFSKDIFGKHRVGVAFSFVPFGWNVAVTELEATFFSEVRDIQAAFIWILCISIIIAAVFLSLFLGYIIKPVEHFTRTIRRITATNDLTERAQVASNDEIGILTHDFNTMIGTLESDYKRMEALHKAEKEAREQAIDREEETLRILGYLSDFHDQESDEHFKRIGSFARLFSKLLGQSEEEQKLIGYSAPLHDIGKIGIPDSALRNPMKLDSGELENAKRHTVLGYNLLSQAHGRYLLEAAKIALTHHERWDGTGYPSGVKGEAIPLSGRIVAIADAFDSLVSERFLKKERKFEDAFSFIIAERGRSFDPHLVDLFEAHFAEFRAIAETPTAE
jgi:response regulator RpfG family c-di-GMP phosphodiesterase